MVVLMLAVIYAFAILDSAARLLCKMIHVVHDFDSFGTQPSAIMPVCWKSEASDANKNIMS
jgi:hypothetical protein